ncbi:MAG: tol-pal system protein YbgF [Methylocystis sp.]|nr:MAG: tol-pal system protein YbgF [Methylocystis sp.]
MITRFALTAALTLSAGVALAYDPYGPGRPDSDLELTQGYNRPSVEMEDIPGDPPGGGGPSPDSAAMVTRIDRLEREIRRLTGQNEELQHKVQVLEEQLSAAKESPAPVASGPASAAPVSAAPSSPGLKRGDAFDPASDPSAPGAPKPLGSAAPSAPLPNPPKATASGAVTTAPPPVREAGQPMDIAHGRLVGDQPSGAPEIAPAPVAVPMGPKEEYEEAVAALKAGRFESAEKSLSTFLAKNPKGKFAPAATFNLGESFFLRQRYREAAEKYLEISQKYGQSAQAPDALLRLGQSLSAMGAKEQACASFNEIGMKYPGSAARIREAAQRESKKTQC